MGKFSERQVLATAMLCQRNQGVNCAMAFLPEAATVTFEKGDGSVTFCGGLFSRGVRVGFKNLMICTGSELVKWYFSA
jgi:hypothetical protein